MNLLEDKMERKQRASFPYDPSQFIDYVFPIMHLCHSNSTHFPYLVQSRYSPGLAFRPLGEQMPNNGSDNCIPFQIIIRLILNLPF